MVQIKVIRKFLGCLDLSFQSSLTPKLLFFPLTHIFHLPKFWRKLPYLTSLSPNHYNQTLSDL
jgi:hypothetical protein